VSWLNLAPAPRAGNLKLAPSWREKPEALVLISLSCTSSSCEGRGSVADAPIHRSPSSPLNYSPSARASHRGPTLYISLPTLTPGGCLAAASLPPSPRPSAQPPPLPSRWRRFNGGCRRWRQPGRRRQTATLPAAAAPAAAAALATPSPRARGMGRRGGGGEGAGWGEAPARRLAEKEGAAAQRPAASSSGQVRRMRMSLIPAAAAGGVR
jgi:hypothetical protein